MSNVYILGVVNLLIIQFTQVSHVYNEIKPLISSLDLNDAFAFDNSTKTM